MSSFENRKYRVVERLLFATDLSTISNISLSYGKAIARYYDAELNAVHVLDESLLSALAEDNYPGANIAQRNATAHLLQGLRNELKQAGIRWNVKLLTGHGVAAEIIKYVERHRPDLLILSTSGARDVKRLALGSTAEQILRNVNCPVLTVGPHVPAFSNMQVGFKQIVYATDFSPEARIGALFAISLASEHDAHISLCHVVAPSWQPGANIVRSEESFRRRLERLVPANLRNWRISEYEVEHGDPAEAILAFARKRNAELIILGAHPASGIATHLLPGVAFRVIVEATCPVLTLRSPESTP